MSMSGSGTTCAACEAEFDTTPVRHLGVAYCCEGCSAGGPCTCSYDAQDLARRGGEDGVDHLGLAFRPAPLPLPLVAPRPVAPLGSRREGVVAVPAGMRHGEG